MIGRGSGTAAAPNRRVWRVNRSRDLSNNRHTVQTTSLFNRRHCSPSLLKLSLITRSAALPWPALGCTESISSAMHHQPNILKPFTTLLALATALLPAAAVAAVGGGTTACGLHGEYFANLALRGVPRFERQDNRLNFDWGTNSPIGGSNTPAFRSFPHSNFSVRWTGKLVPRFTETYAFALQSATGDEAQLTVDGHAVAPYAKLPLKAGVAFPIGITYRHHGGRALLSLRWSSPSTPPEIIDPVSVNGFNLTNCGNRLFADMVKSCDVETDANNVFFWFKTPVVGQFVGLTPDQLDGNNYPKQDAAMEFDTNMASTTYLLRFTGKAKVSCQQRYFGGHASFSSNGKAYPDGLPTGVGYDAATNTTTALMSIAGFQQNNGRCWLNFTDSQRDASSAVNTGISNLQLMQGRSESTTSKPTEVGSIVHPAVKPALQNYVVYRYFTDAFSNETVWGQRTFPGSPNFSAGPPIASAVSKPNWEYLVMLANEMGKDLYISISPTVNNDYYTKLAQLIKYGSDGFNPYTSASQWPATGPVYPPLNSNLRFYIEYSNEVWNFGFGQFAKVCDAEKAAIAAKTADGQIVNYDGTGFDYGHRWQALQTVYISNAFRSVFGDAAMGDRVRVLLFDQYGAYGNQMGQFLDSYFNKTDPRSTFAGPPHPVSYYIWGGGGAIYYGSTHPDSVDPKVSLQDGSFESPPLASGAMQVNPPGTAWTFSGNSGIAQNPSRDAALSGGAAAPAVTPAAATWVGWKFTVGAAPIYVYDVGRTASAGNSGSHNVCIFKADGSGMLTDAVDAKGSLPGSTQWTRVVEPGWTRNLQIPLRLEANTTYSVMSLEQHDSYAVAGNPTVTPGITVLGSVSFPSGAPFDATVKSPGSGKFGTCQLPFPHGH